jgi:hypothetical protein
LPRFLPPVHGFLILRLVDACAYCSASRRFRLPLYALLNLPVRLPPAFYGIFCCSYLWIPTRYTGSSDRRTCSRGELVYVVTHVSAVRWSHGTVPSADCNATIRSVRFLPTLHSWRIYHWVCYTVTCGVPHDG